MAESESTTGQAAQPGDVTIDILYNDDNQAAYIDGKKVAENGEEKRPLLFEEVAQHLIGKCLVAVNWRQWRGWTFPETLPSPEQGP